jgi:nucleotide-binding universal stress UspA family protein
LDQVQVDVAVRTAMGRAMLNRAKETANEKGLSSVRTVLTDGDPASTILEQANKGSFDLVILGSRGLSRVKRLLMGSVSQKVSQLSKCSVLVVK